MITRLFNAILKFLQYNIFASLIFFAGIGIIFYNLYLISDSLVQTFDLGTLFPLIGAALVILASLMFRNSDLKRKRNIVYARAEILNEVRKHDTLIKITLINKLQPKVKRKYIELALKELQSESLIMINEKKSASQEIQNEYIIRTIDNSNLDKHKYEFALTLDKLDSRIHFGENLENEVKSFIRNPLNYSVSEMNQILFRVRLFLEDNEDQR